MPNGHITVNPDSPEAYSVEVEEGDVLEIGRREAAPGKRKLVLKYPEVSGKHAEIRCKSSGWTIVDAGSTNGTRVNSQQITPGKEYPLHTGDKIQIAQYEMVVNPPKTIDDEDEEERDSQDKTQFRIHLINATILVGDIKGFTSLMEHYAASPERVMQAAQSIFERLNEEIHKNYGQLEKIAGDAIMAYWHGDDSKAGSSMQAYQACQTALQMKTISSQLGNDKNLWPFQDHPMMLDMALATGPVAAGALGHASANTNLLGDTANLVFRLEKLIGDDRPGDIVVEGMTYDLAKDHFKFESLGQFNVKGRQKPVDVYRLVGAL